MKIIKLELLQWVKINLSLIMQSTKILISRAKTRYMLGNQMLLMDLDFHRTILQLRKVVTSHMTNTFTELIIN